MCMIDTNHTSEEAEPLIGITLGSISLITVVMNILVLYAVKIEKKLQTVSNLYIISLSCADLIVGAAVMPLNILYLLKNEWILPKEACKFWLSMDYVASTASIFSLFILCIDRFRSVQQPLKYLKYRTKTRASIMIVVAWLLSLLWVIPIFGWNYFSQSGIKENETEFGKKYFKNGSIHTCETDFCKNELFKVLTAVINFYVPSLLMLVFYIKIYKAVRKRYQPHDCINSSFRSNSEKASVHSGYLRETQKNVLQRVSKDVKGFANENQIFDPKKRIDPKHQDGSFAEIPKGFHAEGTYFVQKLHSFPQADARYGMGTRNAAANPATVSAKGQNKDNICSQNEMSKILNECSYAAQPFSKNSPDLMLELSEVCSPQNATGKDRIDLTSLKKTWKKLHSNSINYRQGLRINRDRKAAKQLGIIMAVFMLCWTPYFISFMIVAFCDRCYNHTAHMFTIWLGYVNSTLNPFIYPLCNENFKKAFKKILHIEP